MIKELLAQFFSNDEPKNPESYDDETTEKVQDAVETARYVGYQALGREPTDEMIVEIMQFISSTSIARRRREMMEDESVEEGGEIPILDATSK